jgi:hypothetical protein
MAKAGVDILHHFYHVARNEFFGVPVIPSAFASVEIIGMPVFQPLARDMAEVAFNAEGHSEAFHDFLEICVGRQIAQVARRSGSGADSASGVWIWRWRHSGNSES